ncbi:hypothetical protein ACIBCN_01725 [Nocardia sp. NPDC051052]|uniref:hypothetical protein n=1 Tax=Nocardia sp. NPDC051052 TaxID=3364322 RepID=UPI0037A7B8C5
MTIGFTDTVGDGVLSIDATGNASWLTVRQAAVAMVDITVGAGCFVHVDAAHSATVLAWEVDAAADPEPLGFAAGDPALAALVRHLRERGETAEIVRGARLTAQWSRFAEVAAVARWTMRPVDRAALLLDRAVAEAGVGHGAAARNLFTFAEDALIDFGRRCVDGEMSSAVIDLVRRAAIVAGSAGFTGEIDSLARELGAAGAIADDRVFAGLAEWNYAVQEAGAVAQSTELGAGTVSLTVGSEMLDIAAVPPRIVAWAGADVPELLIEHDLDTDRIVLTALLSDGVDPDSAEARRLLAYAANKDSGALVATAPTRVAGRSISANLPARGHDIDDLHCGVFDAKVDVESLRGDPAGRCLAEVDRYTVEAWNWQRAALAAWNAVPDNASAEVWAAARVVFDDCLIDARKAARIALRKLADGVADTAPIELLLRTRSEAVTAFLDELAMVPAAQARPLLSELVPPEPDDE